MLFLTLVKTKLTELYGEYLTALTEWANDKLDIQFSAQVSYNMAMDMVRKYIIGAWEHH